MPDHRFLVRDEEVQRRVAENDEELERGMAVFPLGDRALEALLQPELVAVGAVVHGAESTDRCSRMSVSTALHVLQDTTATYRLSFASAVCFLRCTRGWW